MPKIGTQKCSDDGGFLPNSYSADLNKRLSYLNQTIDLFWIWWRKKCLVALGDNHRYWRQTSQGNLVKTEKICILFQPTCSCPRTLRWLAKIEELIAAQDGQVCGTVIRTATKGGRVHVLRRTIQHLYPFEVCSEREAEHTDETHASNGVWSPASTN